MSAEILEQAAEFGIKRICQSCSVKYYDLNKSPITCPSCATEYDPEATLSRRRSRIADDSKPKEEAKTAESEEDVVADLPDVELEDDSEFGKPADDSTLLDDDDDDDGPILPEVVIGDDEKDDED
ncbi:MAG: TIGR02300 family protein [Alphaproteobacteria bacterium]